MTKKKSVFLFILEYEQTLSYALNLLKIWCITRHFPLLSFVGSIFLLNFVNQLNSKR
jgi:hypothetical protein